MNRIQILYNMYVHTDIRVYEYSVTDYKLSHCLMAYTLLSDRSHTFKSKIEIVISDFCILN
jgi:hypothetical protein